MVEDLAGFFRLGEFATSATWNGSTALVGIFDGPYQRVDVGAAGVDGAAPSFLCMAKDAVGIARGQALVVDQVPYVIRGIEPDSYGLLRLVLENT